MTDDGSLALTEAARSLEPQVTDAVLDADADADAVDGPTFDEVFRREREAMVRLAYLLLHSQSLAEEAVQDAFARLLDRFETVRNPGGFVRAATVNRCRDLLRRRGREHRLLQRLRPPPANNGQPVGPATGELDDVLAGLEPRRREVVVLRFYLGHSSREIAEILDMREPTVRTTLHRAINDLRDVLQEGRS